MKCKDCLTTIQKGDLALATTNKIWNLMRIPQERTRGEWFHTGCFFEKHRPKDANEAGYVCHLMLDDKKRIVREIRKKRSGFSKIGPEERDP